jgi:hypothetical protein
LNGQKTGRKINKVIPGHGPLSDKAGLEAYLKMLVAIRDNIAGEIKAGKTLDEVIASKPTRVFDPIWGNGFLKCPDLYLT